MNFAQLPPCRCGGVESPTIAMRDTLPFGSSGEDGSSSEPSSCPSADVTGPAPIAVQPETERFAHQIFIANLGIKPVSGGSETRHQLLIDTVFSRRERAFQTRRAALEMLIVCRAPRASMLAPVTALAARRVRPTETTDFFPARSDADH